mmetsp:Transcript_56882/g.122429  ORF Transcript_56882/g.122429 Transcript_56882/m.122429 type:complete len:204 (+) Transcript_56882:1493-2104(+)
MATWTSAPPIPKAASTCTGATSVDTSERLPISVIVPASTCSSSATTPANTGVESVDTLDEAPISAKPSPIVASPWTELEIADTFGDSRTSIPDPESIWSSPTVASVGTGMGSTDAGGCPQSTSDTSAASTMPATSPLAVDNSETEASVLPSSGTSLGEALACAQAKNSATNSDSAPTVSALVWVSSTSASPPVLPKTSASHPG